MNNYDAVYRNTGTTPRTMRRVEDHYALHTFKSDRMLALEFFVEMLLGLGAVVAVLFIGYAILTWL